MRLLLALLVCVPAWPKPEVCARCHPNEVKAYTQFSMAHSLRRAASEPSGSFETANGTTFTVYSRDGATWQRIETTAERSEYKVAYVIGSGRHASGYLIQIGGHFFQSPIAYYPKRKSYGMAPGYEDVRDPDFTRPVTEECLLCHSGKALHIANTVNQFAPPFFEQEAISCERCHGPAEEHLKRPVPGSIVNPAKLAGSARDSVCEQCHLSGVVRILNPGKKFADFRPGESLEDVFTVYREAVPAGYPPNQFKVIGHPEQLAASACARNSGGKLWCGTCHNPHQPATSPMYYAERCLSCHAGKLSAEHTSANRDCVSCHMPQRQVSDGGHTVFTDHRIMRRPNADSQVLVSVTDLTPWRQPAPDLAKRNLALAYISAGLSRHVPTWIVRGYRMLTELQSAFPDDIDVLNAFGTALLQGGQPQEAKFAFDRVLALNPMNAVFEENAGRADLACGNIESATRHLEKALQLDPLLLSAAGVLEGIYERTNDITKQAELAARVRNSLQGHPAASRR